MLRYLVLIVSSLILGGCACLEPEDALTAGELDHAFVLRANVVRPTGGDRNLRIQIGSIATRTYSLMLITNVFPGHVELEDATGRSRRFTQSNYITIQMTGTMIIPPIKFAPGKTVVFEHPLSSFIETDRPIPWNPSSGSRADFPNLETACGGGCTVRCWIEVYARKNLVGGGYTGEHVGKLISEPLRIE